MELVLRQGKDELCIDHQNGYVGFTILTEDDYYVIQSEMLGIIGTGQTEDEAETSFNQEFDFVYQRFNELDDSKLTNHNKLIKSIINQIVDKVE